MSEVDDLRAALQEAKEEADNLFAERDHAREDLAETQAALASERQSRERLEKALAFYADPGSYFAIGFFPDPPCGGFIDDFSDTELGLKPGKRARSALGAFTGDEG